MDAPIGHHVVQHLGHQAKDAGPGIPWHEFDHTHRGVDQTVAFEGSAPDQEPDPGYAALRFARDAGAAFVELLDQAKDAVQGFVGEQDGLLPLELVPGP